MKEVKVYGLALQSRYLYMYNEVCSVMTDGGTVGDRNVLSQDVYIS